MKIKGYTTKFDVNQPVWVFRNNKIRKLITLNLASIQTRVSEAGHKEIVEEWGLRSKEKGEGEWTFIGYFSSKEMFKTKAEAVKSICV